MNIEPRWDFPVDRGREMRGRVGGVAGGETEEKHLLLKIPQETEWESRDNLAFILLLLPSFFQCFPLAEMVWTSFKETGEGKEGILEQGVRGIRHHKAVGCVNLKS